MKNNTNIRLHVSKALFATIAKEVLAESKKMNMSGGAYTEAVKMPKQAKKMEETNQPSSTSTTSVQDMNAAGYGDKPAIPGLREKMSSKEKMAKGLYKEDAGALQPGENVTWLDGSQREYKGVIQSQEEGDYYKVKVTAAPAGGHKVGDILTKQGGDVKKAVGEMQVNVAEDDMINEMDPAAVTDLLSVLAGMGGIALGGLGIVKWQDRIKAKNPELYKKLQSVSSAIKKADPSKDLSEKSVSLNELRKQAKNK